MILRPLEAIDLSRTRISGAGLHYLPAGLKELNLLGTPITNASLVDLERFTVLETLNLSETNVTDDAIPNIQAMIEAQNLKPGRRRFKLLDLRKTPVSDKVVRASPASSARAGDPTAGIREPTMTFRRFQPTPSEFLEQLADMHDRNRQESDECRHESKKFCVRACAGCPCHLKNTVAAKCRMAFRILSLRLVSCLPYQGPSLE